MRLCATVLVLSFAALAGCDGGPTAPAGPPPAVQPPAPAGPAQPGEPASPSRPSAAPAGPLRIDGAAEGALRFDGFGPVRFGDDAQAVRQAWGGDLGAAGPVEPGGCHYLIPQPLGPEGYRIAFMVEGDRFVRVDVADPSIEAPGGARVGMAGDAVRALYPGRVAEQPHKYDPDGRVLRVAAPAGEGALVLELDADGRVDEWRVGIPPQVDYVEGCS
ncbi:hypothetical protein [Luteimonas wenzhouensis]|uniref:Lectin n=1 Tax=Luteimonas wenzhouensis TaxID=2599615 RepID=A0A5C5TT74_9GAMM|nr:hypothetical protein [Luteimonas wenzhouensis]TWT16896.1 hypothetical protein FQY79_14680 [Luteimonas wenzhouensis]